MGSLQLSGNVGAHIWRSPILGETDSINLPGGVLDYFDRGAGPTLLFSHGWLANANLWRKVVEILSPDFRCVVLDLPLGSHRTPMDAAADLSPVGVAGLIAGVIEELDLRDLTLAAQDTEVLGQLFAALEDPEVRAAPVAYGLLLKHPVEQEASDAYALPASRDTGVLRDVAKAMSSTTTAPAKSAGEHLIANSDLPTLLIWSDEDEVFPLAHAERYANALRNGSLVKISDSFSFTPEDQPAAVAVAIRSFAL